jgi:hypothetical protein
LRGQLHVQTVQPMVHRYAVAAFPLTPFATRRR